MAHPAGEAVDAPAPQSASAKAANFENYLFDDDDQEDSSEPDGDDISAETDDIELEGEEEQADDAVEPETAIDPPVSLNAEEKAVFAQLPKEAQDAWAASENRRNTQVQEATTKASNAQREAEARAASANAQAKAVFGQQLDQFVAAFAPQPPDPMLAQQDPAGYIAQVAQYQALQAQHDQLVQQVQGVNAEARDDYDAAFVAQRDRELLSIPEIANAETREGYINRAVEMAAELGYSQDHIAKNATASEIKSLSQIAEWKADAAKYRQALSRQMQKVRSAKGKSLRPQAAQRQQRDPGADWQRVTNARSKGAKNEAFADYLGL